MLYCRQRMKLIVLAVGGLMGYLKSGSQKSLLAGGSSAALLYYVHTQLPTNPVFASALGLGKRMILFPLKLDCSFLGLFLVSNVVVEVILLVVSRTRTQLCCCAF